MIFSLWKFTFLVTLNLLFQVYSREKRQGRGSNNEVLEEVKLIDGLKLLNSNQSAIMFWRPQKVGSSTILSLLVSFGYRYNVIPRRKSPVVNSLCLKIANCALQDLNNSRIWYDGKKETIQTNLKSYIGRKTNPHARGVLSTNVVEKRAERQMYMVSSSHQICNLQPMIIESQLECLFKNHTEETLMKHSAENNKDLQLKVKELFIVRDPLSRAISVYYFWGELFKMRRNIKQESAENSRKRNEDRKRSGRRLLEVKKGKGYNEQNDYHDEDVVTNEVAVKRYENRTARILSESILQRIKIGLGSKLEGSKPEGAIRGTFAYHGDESTVPSEDIALAFARKLPYTAGMPGPSFTWSAFANSPEAAAEVIKTDRMMTIITERLMESLVVVSHYMGWSLADVVVTAHRKALSVHPKHTEWPVSAVDTMKKVLKDWKENMIYDTANAKLDERINSLIYKGTNFTEQVRVLKVLQNRVTKICLSDEYLERYRYKLDKEGFKQHHSNNKLRDAEEKYTEGGHSFSFNSDIMYTYDICGNCEAHGILLAVELGLSKTVDDALLLKDIDKNLLKGNTNFMKCP